MPCYVPPPGPPTRFGLKEAIERRVKQQKEIETHGDFHTTYSTSFRSVLIHLLSGQP